MADCGGKDDMYQSALQSPPSQLFPQHSQSREVDPHLQSPGKGPSTSGVLCLLTAAEEPSLGCAGFLLHDSCGNAIETPSACWNAQPVLRLIRLHKKQQETKYG